MGVGEGGRLDHTLQRFAECHAQGECPPHAICGVSMELAIDKLTSILVRSARAAANAAAAASSANANVNHWRRSSAKTNRSTSGAPWWRQTPGFFPHVLVALGDCSQS